MTTANARAALLLLLVIAATPTAAGENALKLDRPFIATTIDAEELTELPQVSRGLADQLSRVPGVAVGSGPGRGSDVTIRGFNNNLGNNQPVIMIDGRRAEPGFDISAIPAGDIEGIDVLRGTGALALYGSQAANGVIVIRLKRERSTTGTTGARTDATSLPFNPGLGGLDAPFGAPLTPVTPALGVYDAFANNFTGSVDSNALCDFGTAQLLPGWALSPWLDGNEYLKDGYGYYIPFEQPAQSDPPASADNAPANSAAGDAPAADPAPGTDKATPPADDAPDGAPGAAPAGSAASQPATPEPPPKTALQEWDRGVPPWSLIMRSPEVAHLIDQLQPYYKLRFDKHTEMSELGYWELSPTERADNQDAYDAARDIWKGTRREILTLLAPYMDPAIAAAAATGDTAWSDGPGPVLPPDIFGADAPVTHPSQQAATPPPAAPAVPDPAATAAPAAAADNIDTYKLSVGLRGSYGDLSLGSGYRLKGSFSDYVAPDTELPAGGIKLNVQPYLVTPQASPDGGEQRVPAAGALFSPNYPYETKLYLAYKGGLPDTEFNSDLPSLRGATNTTGKVEYGARGTSIDDYVHPGNFSLDWDTPVQPRLGSSYSLSNDNAAVPDSSYAQYAGRYADYDARFEARLEAADNYYKWGKDEWDFGALRDALQREAAPQADLEFDPSRFRIGYNLNTGQAALSIPVYKYEAESVKLGGAGNAAPDASVINPGWRDYLSSTWTLGNDRYYNFRWAEGAKPAGKPMLNGLPNLLDTENDYCATEAFPVTASLSAIVDGRRIADDWFMQRVGLTAPPAPGGTPVVVAVIDTGLDYHHYDLSWDNLWLNTGEIADNGIDDDNNGFVDDMIGWDFTAASNTPWDHDGHGTFVAGLIAADTTNRAGINGSNPNARIMVLKALNNFGHTRASWLAQAIKYAADNGARIINLSAAGPGLPQFVQDAIDYADDRGVLVIVAAGNSAENVDAIGPAGLNNVITVAATGLDDSRASFSNWGDRIAIAAPGMHIKSLRARQTDFRITSADTPYQRGTAILGADRRYYRADGTSFAAPLVSGAASLLWSARPGLTHTQVRRMLEQSARDIDTPGRDQYTGYGLLDARAAQTADPEYFTLAAIDAVAVAVVDGRQVARVTGTTAANDFGKAYLELGAGETPDQWKRIGKPLTAAVIGGLLGDIPAEELQGETQWTIRVITEHDNGRQREGWYRLNIN